MTETIHWFTARQGSTLRWWYDGVLPAGIIEVNPDHPPIMHWISGKSEELKVVDGKCIIDVPNPYAAVTVGLGDPRGVVGYHTYEENGELKQRPIYADEFYATIDEASDVPDHVWDFDFSGDVPRCTKKTLPREGEG